MPHFLGFYKKSLESSKDFWDLKSNSISPHLIVTTYIINLYKITCIPCYISTFSFFTGAVVDVKTKNDTEKRKNLGVKFLLCFSLYTNGKKLLNTKKSAGTIGKASFDS